MEATTITQKLLDTLAEADKGGRLRRRIQLSDIDMICACYRQYVVQPWWILGKGPQKGTGNDTAT